MERLSDNVIDIIDELHTERLHYFSEYIPLIDAANRLAEYEDIGATPDELKTAVSLYLELSQKMRRIVKDMKYYLDANEEDGVVYIPKFVVEEIAYGK